MTSSTAGVSVTSIVVLRPTRISMFGYSTVEKPSSSAVIWYRPGSSPRKRNWPWASVTAMRGAPMPVTVMVTPGRGSPWLSTAVP